MKNRIFIIRLVHSIIYFFMIACLGYILYCAIVGRYDWTLLIAVAAIVIEGLILILNRGRCPLTNLAEKHGAASGSVTDLFLPMWFARNTFRIATIIFIIELIWLAIGYFT
jgi:hypothetical protein